MGNNASYGPFVQSAERQASVHARRGWVTAEQVAEKEQGKVVGFFENALNSFLN